MLAKVMKFSDLSFAEDSTNAWVPERTGDYAEDCARGRMYALELIDYIRMTDCPQAFGYVVKAISAAQVYEAVEIGFCSQIGIHLFVR